MEPTAPMPLLHRIEVASTILGGIGRTKIYDEIKAGRIKTLKIGARTFVAQAELERYVASLEADQ